MKKNYLWMAMAGVALAGCVSDDVVNIAENELKRDVKIKFDRPVLYNNVNSRANVYGEIGANLTTRNYPTNEQFVIYAVEYSKDTPFTAWDAEGVNLAEFNGDAIKYAGISIDGWAPVKTEDNPTTTDTDETEYYYWPTAKQMAFAATSPADLELADARRTYGDTGLSITDFEIQSDPAKQYDLLFSKRTVDNTSDDMQHGASDYSGIPIVFQHALSSVRFSLMNHTQVDVRLKGIKLWGAKFKGNFSEGIAINSGDKYVRDDNVKPAWSLTSDTITESNAYPAFSGEIAFPYNAQYVSVLTDSAKVSTNVCHQLLLMPQALGAPTDSNNSKIWLRVDYTVAGQATHKTVLLNNRMSTESSLNKGDSVRVANWEMGKRYTYRLVYSAETAQKDMIYFAPSTDPWQDVNVVEVKL